MLGIRSHPARLAALPAGRLSSATQPKAGHGVTTNPGTGGRNSDLASAVDTVTARYEAANPASRAQYERARKSLPGGNTRTGMFYTPFPLAIETAAGATVTDVDGHLYTDFVGDFSAGLYGHSHPAIREAVLGDAGRRHWPSARGAGESAASGARLRALPFTSKSASRPRAPRRTPWRWRPPAR